MAAEPPVGFALDEQKLPVGGGDALGGIAHLRGRVGQRKLAEDQRHQAALGKPLTIWRGE
jgi:hypothetical protein